MQHNQIPRSSDIPHRSLAIQLHNFKYRHYTTQNDQQRFFRKIISCFIRLKSCFRQYDGNVDGRVGHEVKKLKLADLIRRTKTSLKSCFRQHDNVDGFVGREVITLKLVDLLRETKSDRGCYLIAGYRGVGKTSIVERSILEYSKTSITRNAGTFVFRILNLPIFYWLYYNKPNKPITIPINLGESKRLSPQELYYTISNILYESIKLHRKTWHRLFSKFLIVTALISFLILIAVIIDHIFPNTQSQFYKFLHAPMSAIFGEPWHYSGYLTLTLVISLLLYFRGVYLTGKIFDRLEKLILRIHAQIEESGDSGIHYRGFKFGRKKLFTYLPLKAREVEQELIAILKELRNPHTFGADIIFLFDEIDKLSERKLYETENEDKAGPNQYDSKPSSHITTKKERIDYLLGALKYFITTARARFIFISGRETLDSYYSERGSANSLYESLFNQVFEVPSLLSDTVRPGSTNSPHTNSKLQISMRVEEYVCARLEKSITSLNSYYELLIKRIEAAKPDNKDEKIAEARLAIAVMRNFIYYLTFHSWGNPKRLASIFESFVTPQILEDKEPILIGTKHKSPNSKHWLYFNFNRQRSLVLAGNIFTIFQHQLSREVSRIGDKLTVSALSALQFILKLHPYGFTRESLHRMSEAINIHRAPELNIIVDDLLSQVFKPYIRRVRNGTYRYRFNAGFEQELRYISHITDLESMSYNFSLDTMNRVKEYFEKDLNLAHEQNTAIVVVKSHITLGDMNAIEQSYNTASRHYSTAILTLTERLKKEHARISDTSEYWTDIELLMLYAEAMLKYGDLEEHRQNYNRAAGIYKQANILIKEFYLKNISCRHSNPNANDENKSTDELTMGDSKWDILKQAFWATTYLSLKRSPEPTTENHPSCDGLLFDCKDPRFYFRRANFNFFLGWSHLENSINDSLDTIFFANSKFSNNTAPYQNERRDFLIASSLVSFSESNFTRKAGDFHQSVDKGIRSNANNNNHVPFTELKASLASFLTPDNYSLELFRKSTEEGYLDTEQFVANVQTTKETGALYLIMCLKIAAKIYYENNLYISATVTHIKIQSYIYLIFDFFSAKDYESKYSRLKKLFEDYYCPILSDAFNNAVTSIDLSRQLESSQFIKTLTIRDYNDKSPLFEDEKIELSELFEMLNPLSAAQHKVYPVNKGLFWQHSIWGQKLASIAYWGDFIRSKMYDSKLPGNYNNKYLVSETFDPTKMPTLSIRSSIMMRWVYARRIFKDCIENQLLQKEGTGTIIDANLTPAGHSFVTNMEKTVTDTEKNKSSIDTNWENAYKISRTLYFVLLDIRLISRKNLEMIFPTMTQAYYVHWRLLTYIIQTLLVYNRINCQNPKSSGNTIHHHKSMRGISFYVQNHFLALDNEFGTNETIAPSHFDYEYISKKLITNLKGSVSLIDQTSRIRTNILQQKYYAHDDHSDPEFRMDWTLSNMFIPSARCMLHNLENTIREIKEFLSPGSTNCSNPQQSFLF